MTIIKQSLFLLFLSDLLSVNSEFADVVSESVITAVMSGFLWAASFCLTSADIKSEKAAQHLSEWWLGLLYSDWVH